MRAPSKGKMMNLALLEVINSLSAVINDIRQQINRIQTNKNSPQ